MPTKNTIAKKKPATREVSPQDICNFILHYCKDEKISIKQMKLHKLAFYCHAWHLVYYKKPLIKDGFQAWIHGPVNQTIWKKYKKFGSDDIPLDNIPNNSYDLPDKIHDLLLDVLEEYSGYTSTELSNLSHLEDPWINTRGELLIYETCHKVIPDKEIREYYGKRVGL